AVRLICDRERDTDAFTPQAFWSFDGQFAADGAPFTAGLARIARLRLVRPGEDEHRDGTAPPADSGDPKVAEAAGPGARATGKPNLYRSKADAQEAHEAIRPTDSARSPDAIASFLSSDQQKLYGLIWNRFVSSQMSPAEFETNSFELIGGRFVFRATATRLLFAGF